MKPTHNSRAVSLSAALAAAALTISSTAYAANYYWDNNDSTAGFGTAGGTWLNPTPGGTTGWSTDSTGASAIGSVTTATADTLFFGTDTVGLATGTVDIGAAVVNVSNLQFGKASGDITLTGGDIAMAGSTTYIRASSGGGSVSNTVTINNDLTKVSGTLTFGRQNTANEKYVMNGVLSGGFGVDGRVTNSTGQVYLNGLNTFTGNFSMTTGQYYVNTFADSGQASSLGAGNSISMGGGSGQSPRLIYTGSTATSTNRTLSVNANGNVGIIAQDGAVDLSGTVRSNSGASTWNLYLSGTADTGTNTISGVMQDNGSGKLAVRVNSTGATGVTGEAGYWVFSGANTYTGSTLIQNSSTLVLGNGGTGGSLATGSAITVDGGSSFIVNQSDTVAQGTDFSDNLSGGGDVIMNGSGRLDLKIKTGTSTTYTGNTIVNSGTLRLVNTADLAGMQSNNFQINNGSTLEIESSVGGNNRSTLLNDSIFTFDSNGGGNIDFVSGNHLAQTGSSGTARFVTTGGSQNTITSSGGIINPQGGGNHVRFDVADGTDDVDLAVSVYISNGTWRKDGAGTLSITSNNNSQAGGAININAGTFEIGGAGRIRSDGAAEGVFANAINNEGVFKHNSTNNQTVSGVIGGTGAVVKDNTGTLTLTGTGSYTGDTTVSAGTLSLASTYTHTGTGDFIVNGGTLEVADGVDISSSAMTIDLGGVISPGNSPGTAITGNQTWNDGGAYLWEINDMAGGKGVDSGWDWLDIQGTLDINATFDILITSLDLSNNSGLADGFDTTGLSYLDPYASFIIATATGGVTGFDASAFNLIDSSFLNPKVGWSISLDEINNDIVLNAFFVPEPSSTALLGLGGLALMLRRKRS